MSEHVFAAVLGGGESRRFGSDKALAEFGGVPMIVRVGERLRRQAECLAVVGHAAGAHALGCACLSDPRLPVRGPLLGILAALEWAAESGAAWLISAPCDVPLVPPDLAPRLISAARAAGAEAAFAATAAGLHPLCAAWTPRLAARLRATLSGGAHPAVQALTPNSVQVHFEDEDAFANINTPAEFERIRARLDAG